MNQLSVMSVVRKAVGESIQGMPISWNGNTPTGVALDTGYVDVDWSGGREQQTATGLDKGLIAVGFQVYGPQGLGVWLPVSIAGDLLNIFRNKSFLAPEGDTGVLYYVATSYADHGTDSSSLKRPYYRVDRVILLNNFTETAVQ